MTDSLSEVVRRQTKHRAVGVTNSTNGATVPSSRTNPNGTRRQGELLVMSAQKDRVS